MFFVLDQPDKIFYEIPDVKDKYPEFKLLLEMDSFVVDQVAARGFMADQYKRKKCHALHP